MVTRCEYHLRLLSALQVHLLHLLRLLLHPLPPLHPFLLFLLPLLWIRLLHRPRKSRCLPLLASFVRLSLLRLPLCHISTSHIYTNHNHSHYLPRYPRPPRAYILILPG